MITASSSSLRSRPLSTRMQESWEPIALINQGGGNRRIDPSRKTANHPVASHALANLFDHLLGEVAQPPRAMALADLGQKVGEHRLALRRVSHLGMKLQPKDRQRAMPHGRNRASGGLRNAARTGRQLASLGRRDSSRLPFRRTHPRTNRHAK